MSFLSWKNIQKRMSEMKKTDWVVLLLFGVLLLVIAIPTGTSNGEKTEEKKEVETETEHEKTGGETNASKDISEYRHTLEQELEGLLGEMEGVGEVRVMITLTDYGEDVLDKDVSTGTDSYSSNTVVYSKENEQVPYVTRQNTPEVEGVLVVAQGADKPSVAADISDAILALFDVEVHKIKIVKMSVWEGKK